MTRNMGAIDRAIRIVAAVALLYAAFATDLTGGGLVQVAAVLVAAVFALTAAAGHCPLYRIVGLRTCRRG
ncbi:MAG: bifunctional protein GlmU [Rhodobacteraceae bacterium]|nr:bifunctional protein GlmU [Paracoccaceae bacterium]MBR26188.1 bifunctional protein GlmU [Paracoccaceae bacterium]